MEVNVIDVGSGSSNDFNSTEYLCREFRPHLAFGLDPTTKDRTYLYGDTLVKQFELAAWTRNGEVRFAHDGTRSHITDDTREPLVPCIDLAEFVQTHAPCVLKLDCEGAERVLIPHLVAENADELLHLAWVEWHTSDEETQALKQMLRCPVEDWHF